MPLRHRQNRVNDADILQSMLCLEVKKDNFDEIMEKIKNEEKLSNSLPVSIKCG